MTNNTFNKTLIKIINNKKKIYKIFHWINQLKIIYIHNKNTIKQIKNKIIKIKNVK